jgi:hypothetical protein
MTDPKDLTLPENNPLIPSDAEPEERDDLMIPRNNPLIPSDAGPEERGSAAPQHLTYEQLVAEIAAFKKTSNAAEFEQIRALFNF